MLTRFGVKNFKGIKEADIEIRPITIFIGPNGSGKSSIAQALMLLKQNMSRNDLFFPSQQDDPYEIINLGKLKDIRLNKNPSNNLEFIIGVKKNDFSYTEELIFNGRFIDQLNLEFNKGQIHFSTNLSKKDGFRLEQNRITLPGAYAQIQYVQRFDIPLQFVTIGHVQGPSGEIIDRDKKILSDIQKLLNRTLKVDLEKFWYIPPIRGTTSLYHPLGDRSESEPDDPIKIHEQRNNDWMSTLSYNKDLLKQVSHWSEQILESSLIHTLRPGKNVTLEKTHSNGMNVKLINEGFGLNQLAYLLTQLALTSPEATLAIDEPEIHLHPGAQIRLMDVLIEDATTNNKNLILVTHSENIIYQALTKVGSGDLKSEDLRIYFFEKGDEGFHARKIEFNEKGQLKEGLPGFFEVNVGQYKQYLDTVLGTEDGGSQDTN